MREPVIRHRRPLLFSFPCSAWKRPLRRSASLLDLWGAWVDDHQVYPARFPRALGYRVRYETSSSILQELTAALADQTLPRQP